MQCKRPLIGISGLARSGKDTFAGFFHNVLSEYANGAELYAFADPLKRAASEMFGLPLEVFYGGNERELINEQWGISPREMLQKLGTEGGRNVFGHDLWIKRAKYQYEIGDVNVPFVITDIRFEDEADFIRDNGGRVIHIVRPDINVKVLKHASEEGIKTFSDDITVINDGDLSDLENAAEEVAKSIPYVIRLLNAEA